MNKIIFALASVLLLGGCAFNKPEKVVVTETVYITPDVPKSLVKPCVAEKPMAPEAYLVLAPVEREQYLTDYSIGLLGVINNCNGQLKGIDKILTEHKKQ